MDVHFPSKQSWWFPKSQIVSLFQRVNHHFRPINPSFHLPFLLPLEERSSAKASPPPQRSPDLKRPVPDWSGLRDIHEKMPVEPTRILWKSGGHSHIYTWIFRRLYFLPLAVFSARAWEIRLESRFPPFGDIAIFDQIYHNNILDMLYMQLPPCWTLIHTT